MQQYFALRPDVHVKGNRSNLMKHVRTHGLELKAEGCSVFNSSWTSAGSVGGQERPCVIPRLSRYGHISTKELLKFEAGL